jgi:hypothetical protein
MLVVRVGAITRGPLERDYPYYLNFLPPCSKILYKLTNHYNPTKLRIETANLSPSLNHKPGQNWSTPKRTRMRQVRADGKS